MHSASESEIDSGLDDYNCTAITAIKDSIVHNCLTNLFPLAAATTEHVADVFLLILFPIRNLCARVHPPKYAGTLFLKG